MAVQDRYFAEILAKPSVYATTDFSLFGYFDSKQELAEMLSLIVKRVRDASDLHVRILDAQEEDALVEDAHFSLNGKKKRGGEKETFDAESGRDILGFINKYFNVADLRPHTHVRYVGEFILQRDSKKDSVILASFTAPSEFAQILAHVAKRVDEEGLLSLTLERHNHNAPKKVLTKAWRMFADGTILVAELEPHHVQLRNAHGAQGFALFLWEGELQ